MQQRRPASGRPSGTDGSDFCYRMLVDPRYTKVAKGKSRLHTLIAIQAVSQMIGVLLAFIFASLDKGLDRLVILSIICGFISLVTGELGWRRSHVNLLRLYITASSISIVSSVAYIFRIHLSFEVIQNGTMLEKLELVEAGRVLLDVPLQIFAIVTTVWLVQNMSPKRAS